MKGRIITNTNYNGMEFDFEVSTADLIAELERRRPDCANCNRAYTEDFSPCDECVWRTDDIGLDNFTPKSEDTK